MNEMSGTLDVVVVVVEVVVVVDVEVVEVEVVEVVPLVAAAVPAAKVIDFTAGAIQTRPPTAARGVALPAWLIPSTSPRSPLHPPESISAHRSRR